MTGHRPDAPSALYGGFVDRVRRSPGAVAIVDEDRTLTYAELERAVAGLRAGLHAQGVVPGELVGISLPRGWQVVSAILATHAHGCGYVPLDPDYPAERLAFMVADSGIGSAIVDGDADHLPPAIRRVGPQPGEPMPIAVRPAGTPAYLIYTSGSTGVPKGVVVPESAVCALFRSCREHFSVGPGDVWTAFHSYSFDFSVWEIWGALLHGGQLVIVPAHTTARPEQFLSLLSRRRVTVLSQVPSSFKYLVRAYRRRRPPLSLRYVVFGGEALHRPSVREWMRLRPGAETLVNMYGITETTVHVTHHRLEPADVEPATAGTPIGRPLAHHRVALLDADRRPVARGEVGEIHVAGEGLACGYHGRPQLTAERFPVMSVGESARRWYRSGDLAREVPGGGFEYLGRTDRQVSLRGFRVEPGETEATLAGEPSVADAVVDVAPVAGGERILVAYVVVEAAREPEADVVAALRRRCGEALPPHLRPNRIVVVERIPVTASGKVDHQSLRAMGARGIGEGKHG